MYIQMYYVQFGMLYSDIGTIVRKFLYKNSPGRFLSVQLDKMSVYYISYMKPRFIILVI